MVGQDPPQCVDGAGVLTGSLQLRELVPHRANKLASLRVVGQPVKSPVDRCSAASTPGIGLVEGAGSLTTRR